jgi:hypothetical protein
METNKFQLMPLTEAIKFEKMAEDNKVSEVARSPNGFFYHYKKNKGKLEDSYWIKKRNAYLSRTLPQFRKNPTFRRALSLICWAYMPTTYAELNNLKIAHNINFGQTLLFK